MWRWLSRLVILSLALACVTVKREDLGHGFKVVTHRERSDSGFERYGYFAYLHFHFKDLGPVGFVEVSPSGLFALYEQDGTLMLYSVRAGTARDVTEGIFSIPRAVKWQEDEGMALVLYYDDRKPTTVSLGAQAAFKHPESAAHSGVSCCEREVSGSVMQLGEALHRLLSLPLQTQADVKNWYEQADAFRRLLRTMPPTVSERLPHELEHFLSDADVRLKDEGYAEVQEAKMRALSAALIAGSLPRD